MTTNDFILAIQAKRRAAGLVVSIDREDAETQAQIGRATRACATVAERDAYIAAMTALGRNPKIEAAQ